jgi:glutathione S-transferase
MNQGETDMFKLYTTKNSGNGYKVRLLAAMVGAPHELVLLDFATKDHKTPAFLKLSPRGQVPTIEVDGKAIWDSTACLVYVARKYGGESWLPIDPLGMAEVEQYLALASNEIQFGIQAARGIMRMGRPGNLEECQARGKVALDVIEKRLSDSPWLALGRPTIADIACQAYVGVADEAGIDMSVYPNVLAWLKRIEGLPGWVGRSA